MEEPQPSTATANTAQSAEGNVAVQPAAVEGVPPQQGGPIAGAAPGAGVPGPGVGVPFQSASLYVGDLHPDVTEALLYDIFNAVGPVASIRVCRDAVTRRSLGYAYVNFHNVTDAERALDTMNYTLIKDRPCRMMWSQRDPSLRKNGAGNVFVKHLDLSIDNKALYDTFSLFGNILSCKVVTDVHGKSRGYGFVHFETTEAAEEAIKKINGMMLAGKEVFVGKFLKKNERPSAKDWTNIYVKNLPKTWDQSKLETVFSECGPVSSSIIMKDEEGVSRGFGFIDFVEHESAVAAIEKFNGYEPPENKLKEEVATEKVAKEEATLEGTEENKENSNANGEEKEETDKEVTQEEKAEETKEPYVSPTALVVCRAQKKSERARELAQKFEQLKVERQSQYQGVNLYVKNLEDGIDDEMFRKEFEQFGTITSAKVMREKTTFGPEGRKLGASKGFGFVCFSAPEEAVRAVTEMNGKLLMGKPLYVALAQRKEQRRAQLEAHHRQQQRMMNVPGMGPQHGMFPYNAGMNNMNGMGGLGTMNAMGMGMNNPGDPQGQQGFNRFNQAQMQMMGMGMMRGQRGPNQGPQSGNPGGPRGMPQQFHNSVGRQGMSNMQFSSNARNTSMQPGGNHPQNQMRGSQMMNMGGPDAPLNAEALASANQQQRKTMIGEKLYPMVHKIQPQFAAKITGMLLEMDNNELLHLLESPEALLSKINEAMDVLKKASSR